MRGKITTPNRSPLLFNTWGKSGNVDLTRYLQNLHKIGIKTSFSNTISKFPTKKHGWREGKAPICKNRWLVNTGASKLQNGSWTVCEWIPGVGRGRLRGTETSGRLPGPKRLGEKIKNKERANGYIATHFIFKLARAIVRIAQSHNRTMGSYLIGFECFGISGEEFLVLVWKWQVCSWKTTQFYNNLIIANWCS